MRTPDEVAAMQRLHELGWGTRRIATEVGCNRETGAAVSDGWRLVAVPGSDPAQPAGGAGCLAI